MERLTIFLSVSMIYLFSAICVGAPLTAQTTAKAVHRQFVLTVQGRTGDDVEIVVETEKGGDFKNIKITEGNISLVTLRVAAKHDILMFQCLTDGYTIEPTRIELQQPDIGSLDIPRQLPILHLIRSTPSSPDKGIWDLMEIVAKAAKSNDCDGVAMSTDSARSKNPDIAKKFSLPLAEFFFDCGVEARPEKAINFFRKVIAFLEISGTAWCEVETAGLLSASYERLGELSKALASTRRASCSDSPVVLEWDFYFSLRLGKVDEAALLARQRASGEQKKFLVAWTEVLNDRCPSSLDSWPRIDPSPCRALPLPICLRRQVWLIMECGGNNDMIAAGATLRSALPKDFETLNPIPLDLQGIALDLAEMEFAREKWAAAAQLFSRLAQEDDIPQKEQGRRWCRYGNAELRARSETEAQNAFSKARKLIPTASLDRLVALNNELILAERLGMQVDPTVLDTFSLEIDTFRLEIDTFRLEIDAAKESRVAAEDYLAKALSFNRSYLYKKIESSENLGNRVNDLRRQQPEYHETLKEVLEVVEVRAGSPVASATTCSDLAVAGNPGDAS